jgi:hypothetical protein
MGNESRRIDEGTAVGKRLGRNNKSFSLEERKGKQVSF